MKIKELHIERFGNIKDLDLTISDSMNFLYGFNEADKTAVVDFIIIMLYGTVNRYREDIREKYLPDDGADMCGSLVFEYKDEEFVLERIFDSGRHKKDKIKLINKTADTSEELAFNVKPGEHLFKVNKDIFWRNAYINESAGLSMMQTSHTEIMSSMLSNLITTASEKTSVSDVAGKLNKYFDSNDESSMAFILAEKKEQLDNLKDELRTASETEKSKLKLQNDCNKLQSEFQAETSKHQIIKTNLEIQDMLFELDSLHSQMNNEQNLVSTSDRYNELNAILKKNRINDNRKVFHKTVEKYNKICEFRKQQDADNQKIKNMQVELGRYTPNDNPAALQNVIDNQKLIEQTSDTLSSLKIQYKEKQDEEAKAKELVSQARFELETAELDLTRHEEISNNKIDLAEDRMHNSSQMVDMEPVKKSKNLVLACVILIILALALIIFITNIVMVVIISLGMLSCMYAIFSKIGKEKTVKKYGRVNETELFSSQIALRNLKNQCNEEREKYLRKISSAKKQLEEAKNQSSLLKSQLDSLSDEIKEAEKNLEEYMNSKEKSEKKFSSLDPKFFSLRNEISEIEQKISIRDSKIKDMEADVISSISPIQDFSDYNEAEKFIAENIELLEEEEKLSNTLYIIGDKEKRNAVKAENQNRMRILTEKVKKASKDKKILKLSQEEYSQLKQLSIDSFEKISSIQDQYISTITSMKIQYNDSKCVANLEKKIAILESEIEALEIKMRSVKIAIDTYNDSLYEIREKYAPSVARRTSEILAELTKGKYSSISIKGGRIVVKDKTGNPVNFETISKSTCDQIYFSLRLAVSEITAQKMNYPVILDDIFIRFNEQKAAQLLKFLIKYSENSQIIIFSNQNQISSIVSQEQIPIENINMISMNQ